MAALPDIGPTITAGRFRSALFECVPLAFCIGLRRRLLSERLAQFAEMRLRCGALGQVGGAPFGDEVGGKHCSR
jgi:hypothetical protein